MLRAYSPFLTAQRNGTVDVFTWEKESSSPLQGAAFKALRALRLLKQHGAVSM
jgi:hypothetical protein